MDENKKDEKKENESGNPAVGDEFEGIVKSGSV